MIVPQVCGMVGKLGSSLEQEKAVGAGIRPQAASREMRLLNALDRAHRGEWRAWAEFAELHDQASRDGDQALAWQATAGLMITGQHFRRFERFEEGLAELKPLRAGAAG